MRGMLRTLHALGLVAALAAGACDTGSAEGPQDTVAEVAADAAGADAAVDSGPADTAAPPDAGPADTAAPPDAGPADTAAPPDAGPADTAAPPDAGPADTAAPPDVTAEPLVLGYPVVDTGQVDCFDTAVVAACPAAGAALHGQDAQHVRFAPQYAVSADGLTVTDTVTGLTWQRSPDTDGDGSLTAADKLTWAGAQARPAALNAAAFGGYDDWRLPTIEELYSLILFSGKDVSGKEGDDTEGLTPFLDTEAFAFAYGDTAAGERLIDAQYASSTLYVDGTANGGSGTLFGVNFADGRIKGYGLKIMGKDKTFFVQCVRGNPAYGVNDLVDGGDGTVTDRATGLMWAQADSGEGLDWPEALAWVAERNAEGWLGHADWRLPDAKELQSLVDYTRSPATTGTAALDPLLDASPITNEAGQPDFPSYWASTTHATWNGMGGGAVYVAFGRALGFMGAWVDVHGAGAQRSDPKVGDPADYPTGFGPQGDAIRIYNHVRLVRDVPATLPLAAWFTWAPAQPVAGEPASLADASSGAVTSWSWDFGDGGASDAPTPAHTWAAPGSYTVALTVGDGAATATASREVVVGATGSPPVASFTVAPASPVAGSPAQLTDTSSGAPTTWAWTFGDGGTAALAAPTHTWATAGTYTVTLTVTSGWGTDTASKQVVVAAGGTPGGPTACNVEADCDAPGVCPPEAALGCTCAASPQGEKLCVPACDTNADCPAPPDQTLVCAPTGVCVPQGGPPPGGP